MFGVKQPTAMLMSAYRAFYDTSRQTFTNILSAVAIISFRYNVICSLPPQDQEGLYSSVAIRVENNELSTFVDVIHELRDIYPDDNYFTGAFSSKQLKTTNSRNQKVVQYILKSIEQHVSGQAIDLSTNKFNIEHVLPQKSNETWKNFNDITHNQSIYRLANMIILEKGINNKIGNSNFEEKRKKYKESKVPLTLSLSEKYDDWSPAIIDSRQKYLAKQAKSIWKIQVL